MRSITIRIVLICMGWPYFQDHLHAQKDPVQVLLDFYTTREEASSVYYEVDFKMKSFSMVDTLQYLAKVNLIRKPTDTLYNGWLSLDMDSIWLGYDGRYIYNGNKRTLELTKAEAAKHPHVYIGGTFYGHLIDEGFMKTSRTMLDVIRQNLYEFHLSDTIINASPCLGILIKLPDQEGFTDQTLFLAIDTLESVVRHRKYSVLFQENEQYQEWNFYNISMGHDTIIPALKKSQLDAYQFETLYTSKPVEDSEEDSLGYFVFDLAGKRLQDHLEVNLNQDSSDFILLDFWYTSCYPCIKAIPHVNQLHAALKDKSVSVFGVNPIDKLDKDAARLEKFLRNNPMTYPTIMPDEASRALIDVPGYPTFIILDRDRKVIYSTTGYSENLYEEVMAVLEPRLK